MNLLYELWLHDICDFDPKKVDKCIYIFKNAENAFCSKPYSIERIKAFGMTKFLSAPKDFFNAERIIADCKEKDIHIITIDDENYPDILKEIYLPPRILFVKGNISALKNIFGVCAVGTRKSTSQGNLFIKTISKDLVKNNNITIVSGMAEGIDTHAHKGALEAGGKTIAVLAGGVDIIYPPSNKKLYYEILKNGAVISEKPPGTIGKPYFYIQRNRIMAGLSKAVIAVEGTFKSGTRHTITHAQENNRDIYAVPSSPLSVQSQIPNQLIKEGAKPVLSAEDIIEDYAHIYPEYFNISSEEEKAHSIKLNDEETKIVNYIKEKGGTVSADDLVQALNIPIGSLNGHLTVLCIKSVLTQTSQNQYLLKEV